MIIGHEGCAEVVEVGSEVKDSKPGDRVLVLAITPDWNSLEAQAGYSMHSNGMLAGWKFSNFKDGPIEEQIMQMTNGKGVDRVCIAGGNCKTFEVAVKALKPGGKILVEFAAYNLSFRKKN